MDPKTLLDYALFQLTPTRTRCDLVVFAGGISEKLASGLVEPFVCHLKFAKDQIPKGGYSITLKPPRIDASWFTKATFQRFVRFVSTPEVLERFARLEKEILQIESSVQPNEFANGNAEGQGEEGSLSITNGVKRQSTNSSKLNGDVNGIDEAVQEENSKIRLQRLLDTRKALLRKEQAMVYARALAAGFELDNIDDLIFFADAFGASRLRDACMEFKELCKKKHSDGLWMDELAAMQASSQPDLPFLATSGVILACESTPLSHNIMLNSQSNGISAGILVSNGSLDASSDSFASQANSDTVKDNNLSASDQTPPKVQVPMSWPNQIPQYMYNFQGPVQQMPPYQAYPFPGMPPYYPFPREPDRRRHQKSSSSKKEKSPNVGPGTSEDEQTESSDSDTRSDPEAVSPDDRKSASKEESYKKKHRKKSSKTVVIRNINYITSKSRNEEKDGASYDSSPVEDVLVDEDSLRQKVEEAVGLFEKHHKTANNKKRGGNKSANSINGSSGSAEQELESDPVNDTSERGKGNENWDAFQNLLMKEKYATTNEVDSQQPPDVLDEHITVKSSIDSVTSADVDSVSFDSKKVSRRQIIRADSFIVTERIEANEVRANMEDFGSYETLRPNIRRRDSSEALIFPERLDESNNSLGGIPSECGRESSIIKNGLGEDWFVANHSRKSDQQEVTVGQEMLDGGYAFSSGHDCSHMETTKNIVPIDDSFMVQVHTSIDDQYDTHWKTDISMVSDMIVTQQPENGIPDSLQNKIGKSGACEPDDLHVVLSRDSGFETARASWSPEMDYGLEASFTEAEKSPFVETNEQVEDKASTNSKIANGRASTGGSRTNNSQKLLKSKSLQGSPARSKYDALAKSKTPFSSNRSMTQKSKLEKEEEARKRMEELLIQRQKRIAERTAVRGLTPAVSKKVPVGDKLASTTPNKHRSQLATQASTKSSITSLAKDRQLKKTSA
ncbi:COP1-interacting protein 7 [Diospyros lotus]|uniref:COP1-interacting protein 7 n=1 Tax=Diospyros lotus TaxID=55363 RepID=UPI0022524F44|nr:COP1-interacting protein 7 [Diospyros lotus]